MGGDAFEGVQKLTNDEYINITSQLIEKISPICDKIEPYIPLPQKQIHGDVDFLVILKDKFKSKDIITEIKIQKYIINGNQSINSVYKNKQVDFFIVKTQKQFQLASFYKSYSGIGAYLGVFLPTNQVKLTPKGLYAIAMHKHLKFQFLLTDQVPQILGFYGLDYKVYKQGFKTRQNLFQFLRNTSFLDEQKFAYHEAKAPTKLMVTFAEYLKKNGIDFKKPVTIYNNPLQQTLTYFKKQQQFKTAFENMVKSIQRSQNLNNKFNGSHILNKFDIKPKQLNECKAKFQKKFKDQEEYYKWIEQKQLEEILKEFGEKCGLKEKA